MFVLIDLFIVWIGIIANEFAITLRQTAHRLMTAGAFMPVIMCLLILMFLPSVGKAEALRGSLFISVSAKADTHATASGAFIGRAEGGMFADHPAQEPIFSDGIILKKRGSDVQIIRSLIQEAESGIKGYDAVQFGARIKPDKNPSKMTLNEIFTWIKATPGQPHAIGRYQFVPITLRRLIAKTGMKMSQRFDAKVQDELADVLLLEAGLRRFRTGALERHAFMNNLAKIWAGLPNSTGQSHYDGYAGNKAVISWSRFDAVIAGVGPSAPSASRTN